MHIETNSKSIKYILHDTFNFCSTRGDLGNFPVTQRAHSDNGSLQFSQVMVHGLYKSCI